MEKLPYKLCIKTAYDRKPGIAIVNGLENDPDENEDQTEDIVLRKGRR